MQRPGENESKKESLMEIKVHISELQLQLMEEKVQETVTKAYLAGLEEGATYKQYPPLLTRKDLGEIFQVTASVVSRLVKIESFPKFEHVQGRYPRDAVFKWLEKNTIDNSK